MELEIKGQRLKVTKSLRDYVEEILKRVLIARDHITHVVVMLAAPKKHASPKKGRRHIASVKIHVKGKVLFLRERTTDLYASIDIVMGRLYNALRDYKMQLMSHRGPKANHALNLT